MARSAYWSAVTVLIVHVVYLALLGLSLRTVSSLQTTDSALFAMFPVLGLAALVVAVLPPGQRALTRLGGLAILVLTALADLLLVALVRGGGGAYAIFLTVCALSIVACGYLIMQRRPRNTMALD